MQSDSSKDSDSKDSDSKDVVGYDRVREILRKRCVTCHNTEEMRGDLDLADLKSVLAGSASGPVVIAGQANQSMLYKTAAHLEDPVMPPNSPPIPARELDLLRRWIDGGLLDSSDGNGANKPLSSSPVDSDMLPKSQGGNSETASPGAPTEKLGYVKVLPVFRAASIATVAGHPSLPIAAIPGNQQIVLVDTSTGELVKALDFPEGDVTALEFSRDGSWLIAGGGVAGLSGRVVGFDVETGERVFELADEHDTILALDISPDKQKVAIGGPTKVVRVLRIQDGAELHTHRKHTDWVLTARFSPDGLLLASGDRFGGLFVWNTETGEEFQVLRGHVGGVNQVDWDTTSETLISAGEDAQVRTWNMHHGELTSSWDGGVGAILDLHSRDGKLAVAGRTKAFAAWQGPEILLGRHQIDDQVESVAFTDGARQVIAGDALGNIYLVGIDDWKDIRQLKLPESEQVKSEFYATLASNVASFNTSSITSDVANSTPKELTLNPLGPNQTVTSLPNIASLGSEATVEEERTDLKSLQASIPQASKISKNVDLNEIDQRLASLQKTKLELDQMAKSTEESMRAMVAALANLHTLQKQLETQQQSQAELMERLEAERTRLQNGGDPVSR